MRGVVAPDGKTHGDGQGPRSSVNVTFGSSSCSRQDAGQSVTVVTPGTRVTTNPSWSSSHGPGSTCCRRCGRPPSIPTRSTIFSPGFCTVTVQEHSPGGKVHVQLRHGHVNPKRSEQYEREGQPVSMAEQAIGSSPGVHGMKPSLESANGASSVGVGSSSTSVCVSALASTTCPGSAASLEQEIWIVTVRLVTRPAQCAREARERARLIADLGSAKERSAQASAQTTFAPNEDRTRAK